MSVPPDKIREALGRVDDKCVPTFDWRLTSPTITDSVKLLIAPHVLPVIFVPGIMGSNLKQVSKKGGIVWRLDKGLFGIPTALLKQWVGREPALKQRLLHPDRVEVDPRGATPSKPRGSVYDVEQYKSRGWGEVGEGSYHDFLIWLEDTLNGQGFNPALWRDFYYPAMSATPKAGQPVLGPKLYPGITMSMRGLPDGAEKGQSAEPVTSDDLLKRACYGMPVYACGYNWLASNAVAGELLAKRIIEIIAENNRNGYKCEQVVLVTHSMGGIVARYCQTLDGMASSIAGIVHGVMPTIGAAVAYRRCKVGMWDEDWKASLVIGTTGQQVTAVFAQAPGALEMLPTQQYRAPWLGVVETNGRSVERQPLTDPYNDIYLRRDRWWGLVREEWLSPVNGLAIKWQKYMRNVSKVKTFHGDIANNFHAVTYIFYGANNKESKQASFETIQWRLKPGIRPNGNSIPSPAQVDDMGFAEVRDFGSVPSYIGGQLVVPAVSYGTHSMPYQTSYWELHCEKQDGSGDGTVPISSGSAPMHLDKKGCIKQQFGLVGFSHEEAYRHKDAQQATLYSLMKIARLAKKLA